VCIKGLMRLRTSIGAVLAAIAVLTAYPAIAADKVVLATNWLAQPELGGFYQALVDGTYAAANLDVTIKPGGPMINNRPLLAFGKVDFLVGTNLLQAFDAQRQGIPTKVVAAIFQKDPQCILAHADGPLRTWDDLKGAPLFMGNSGRQSFFLWMNAVHGFPRAKLRSYNHSLAPFLADKSAAIQGFATAEPQRIAEVAGREPRVFLLADHGWNSYSTVLETRAELIDEQPDLVQRFVDASITGWRRYLAGGEAAEAADAFIKQQNKAMTDPQIDYSRRKMRELELLGPGDPETQPIGRLDAKRVGAFLDQVVAAGMYKPGEVNAAEVVTLQFIEPSPPAQEP
jgi:NitT/TauT family transport system substrate-binding protein